MHVQARAILTEVGVDVLLIDRDASRGDREGLYVVVFPGFLPSILVL